MRTQSIIAFIAFIVLFGVYQSMIRKEGIATNIDDQKVATQTINHKRTGKIKPGSLLSAENKKQLDQLGSVINESNVDLDQETIKTIKEERKKYDALTDLKDKQNILEQSFTDSASTINDIKKVQASIATLKNNLKLKVENTEKWDPRFVFYLMIQENYTFAEINQISSLSDNGYGQEEINYINDLVKSDGFQDRITAFKSQNNRRDIASTKTRVKDVDEFNDRYDDPNKIESKIVEMNNSQDL